MGKKYIVNPPENPKYILEICVDAKGEVKVYGDKIENFTPYTEPDLDAIRKEEYYKGFQAGSANTSLVITDNTIRERIEEAYQRGYDDAKHECQDCQKIMMDAEQERVDKVYQRGLNNAWDAARKIAKLDTDEQKRLFGCFGIYFVAHEYSASECIEKIRQYEQEKEEQIQVGDEVIPCYTITDPNSAIVTRKWKDNEGQDFVDTIGSNGSTLSFLESHVDKTGRHFPEIAEVLQKMNEDDG